MNVKGKHRLLNGDTRQGDDVNFVLKFMGHIRIKFTQNMACVVFMSKRRNHTNFYIYIFFKGVGLQIAIQIILLIILQVDKSFRLILRKLIDYIKSFLWLKIGKNNFISMLSNTLK